MSPLPSAQRATHLPLWGKEDRGGFLLATMKISYYPQRTIVIEVGIREGVITLLPGMSEKPPTM
jgi:hypothetical protein